MTTTERAVVDPAIVERQNRLFDLYNSWPGDPDDDPEFVAQAREIMGLAPLDGQPVKAAAGQDITPGQTRSLDTSGEDMDETELDETEELDEEAAEDELDEDEEPEPVPYEPLDATAAQRALDDGSLRLRGILETRLVGKDVTPGHDQLHHYWTKDPRGLAKWVKSLHPATALHRHLTKFVGPERAWRMANEWHKEVFGIYPGEKKGKNPLGPG